MCSPGRSAVAERSKALRFRLSSWIVEEEGLRFEPRRDLYRNSFLLQIQRLKKGDCFENELERQQCDEAKQEVVRINLLRLD